MQKVSKKSNRETKYSNQKIELKEDKGEFYSEGFVATDHIDTKAEITRAHLAVEADGLRMYISCINKKTKPKKKISGKVTRISSANKFDEFWPLMIMNFPSKVQANPMSNIRISALRTNNGNFFFIVF